MQERPSPPITVTVTEAPVAPEQRGQPKHVTWPERYKQSRVSAVLASFPSRVFGVAALYYALLTVLHDALSKHQPAPGLFDLVGWANTLAAPWRQWDVSHFLGIAQHGYTNQGQGAFFPLYPLLIRVAAWPLGNHFILAALLVSWLATWGSYLWFYRLAEREYGAALARLALLFLACCPVSFFTFAPYSESVFLLVSIGAVERARAGRLWQASALAALGVLARPTGILLFVPLAWEWGRRSPTVRRTVAQLQNWLVMNGNVFGWTPLRFSPRRWAWWRSLQARPSAASAPLPRLALLSLGLIPLALLGYMLFLKSTTGNPLAFLQGESHWSRSLTPPWETAHFFAVSFQSTWQEGNVSSLAVNLLDLLLVLPLPVLVFFFSIRRHIPWLGAALYQCALTVMLVALPVHTGIAQGQEILLSTQRFMLPAFPLFLLMGHFGVAHPRLYRLVLATSIVLLTIKTLAFLNGAFIA